MTISPEIINEAELIWKENIKIEKFGSRFGIYPIQKSRELLERIYTLQERLDPPSTPIDQSQLLEGELFRHLDSRALSFSNWLEGKSWSLEDHLRYYGLQRQDLVNLQPWLVANRQAALQASENAYDSFEVSTYEMTLPMDVPRLRDQAIGIASNLVESYHQNLCDLFSSVSDLGTYLRQLHVDVILRKRSEYNFRSRRLAFGLTSLCYEKEDGTIGIWPDELIRLYGHEGLTHALKSIITQQSDLPTFLKESTSASVAAEEAIALHMQRVIFDDLKASPETQKKLGIIDIFPRLYEEKEATRLLDRFQTNFTHYGLFVLADPEFGDPEDPDVIHQKTDLLSSLAINPVIARNMVEDNRRRYDSHQNLDRDLVSELRYSSPVVDQVLEIFAQKGIDYSSKEGRGLIDLTLLTGCYTPTGLLQRATLVSS